MLRDDWVAGPLREEPKSDMNQKSMTIAFGFREFENVVFGKLLEREGSFNFSLNKLNSNVGLVIIGIVVSEDFEGSVGSVLLNIPTGRFSKN